MGRISSGSAPMTKPRCDCNGSGFTNKTTRCTSCRQRYMRNILKEIEGNALFRGYFDETLKKDCTANNYDSFMQRVKQKFKLARNLQNTLVTDLLLADPKMQRGTGIQEETKEKLKQQNALHRPVEK